MPTAAPPLNIKDPEVYKMARKLATLTGTTLTSAVRTALRHQLERQLENRGRTAYIERIEAVADRIGSLPVADSRTVEEIVGYDEHGAPA